MGAQILNAVRPKTQRCAIYTRKSTEHNLDLEFNSLDAQREASEAYIKSQAHEGWRLIPDHYDDCGLSGASLDRPALQNLLTDVRAGKITVVVVYKVDRLTRSLADFAKLVELFDQYGVSFVSITQSFNTTSSMGRLTLNVLLSFAQFEREVIGERVRDKIAASKRKGLWVGGPVPLGYRCLDKKLENVPEEAEAVRTIFSLYLELGSMGALMAELDRRNIQTKVNGRRDGRQSGGIRFGVGPLAHLLKNRFYIGEVTYRGEVYRGEHEAILSRDLFDAVQEKLAANAVARQVRLRGSDALLTGRLFDDRGNLHKPDACEQEGRALPVLCLAGAPAESQGRSRQHRSGAGSRNREARMRRRPPAPGRYRERAADHPYRPRADRTPCRARGGQASDIGYLPHSHERDIGASRKPQPH